MDYLLRGGQIVDGTGARPYQADVLIKDGKIANIGETGNSDGALVLEAEGKCVTPGFIDIHRHCDLAALERDFGEIELRQGITTIFTGNCGMSPYPSAPENRKGLFQALSPCLGGTSESYFRDCRSYTERLARTPLPVNMGGLIGAGTVKIAVKGFSDTPFSSEEQGMARDYFIDALENGVFGISLGIMYVPECYTTLREYVALLKPCAPRCNLITVHIRAEGDHLVDAVNEALSIGHETGIPVHISHFKSCGLSNWGRQIFKAIERIEAAQASGQDVSVDFYPYNAGSTTLLTMLPPSFIGGDLSAAIASLNTANGVERLRSQLSNKYEDWDNYPLSLGWGRIIISSVTQSENLKYLGKSVLENAETNGFLDSVSFVAHLLVSEQGQAGIIVQSMCAEDIDCIARRPYSIVISDALYGKSDTPHPRLYGAFPKIIREYVKERKVLSLEQAVYKMSGSPAKRMGLKGKGMIRKGYDADLLVFDPVRFCDHANYSVPKQFATGLDYCFVNGKMALNDDRALLKDAGLFLKNG